jgi:hypothetical protein
MTWFECPLWVISGNGATPGVMSVLPLKADIRQREWRVRFVPQGDIGREQPRAPLHGIFDTMLSVVLAPAMEAFSTGQAPCPSR